MRRIVPISDPAFTHDPADPEGFRCGMARLGPELGAQQTGATVYELPPGQAICPYHYEYGEEEWLLVLAGRPSVRTPEGTERLAPHDVAFFPRGPAGAHQVRNDTGEPARVLMWSTVGASDRHGLSGQRQGRRLDGRQGRGPDGRARERRGLLPRRGRLSHREIPSGTPKSGRPALCASLASCPPR